MTAPAFVDANVLVYRHDAAEPVKQPRADAWHTLLWRQRIGRLSFQVLQELYATLTRGRRMGVDRTDAQGIVLDYLRWAPLAVDFGVLRRAWSVQDRFRLSWWDSLIVAAAQASDCPVLLTEDLQDGQRFDGVRVVDPFASPHLNPEEVLEAR